MDDSNKLMIAKDLAWIGLVSTAISIPIGLWAVPRFRGEQAWVAAALLTGAGFLVKKQLMKGSH